MSELINNSEFRRAKLQEIIMQLHAGADVSAVKQQFRHLLDSVGATEIAHLESELIAAGVPEEEVKRLCDVHVALFEEALEAQAKPETLPGHPVHTFRAENTAAEEVLRQFEAALESLQKAGDASAAGAALAQLQELAGRLWELDKHYLRKEHLLFPYLEKYGIKGPSSVMWALHDDIRAGIKRLRQFLGQVDMQDAKAAADAIAAQTRPLFETIRSMFYKEDNILFPMSLEHLTEDEWLAIKNQSGEIGFAYITPGDEWPVRLEKYVAEQENAPALMPEAYAGNGKLLPLDTGALSLHELNRMLLHLPIDITFVDKDDVVRYFSAGPDRIFVRTPAVIGRKVQNCHPPASVHVVNRILDDFKAGRRDSAEFWIQFQGRFVHIRYFAVRDEHGAYMGTLEVTQDITHIRELQGERRLLSEETPAAMPTV